MFKTKMLITSVVCVLFCGCGKKTPADQKLLSCQDFVTGFYDWYVPIVLNERSTPASTVAVAQKGDAFAPELKSLLEAELKIHAKQKDLIEGLDFDPFLYSQDPVSEYKVGKSVLSGDKCSVEVIGVSHGKVNTKPNVILDLEFKAGKWFFVNFHYGASLQKKDENLLDLLTNMVRNSSKQ